MISNTSIGGISLVVGVVPVVAVVIATVAIIVVAGYIDISLSYIYNYVAVTGRKRTLYPTLNYSRFSVSLYE